MYIYFEFEFCYEKNTQKLIPILSAISSIIFSNANLDEIRTTIKKTYCNKKFKFMEKVLFQLYNLQPDDSESIETISHFILMVQTMIGLFPPDRKKLKKTKRFLLINYKYLLTKKNFSEDISDWYSPILEQTDILLKQYNSF